MNFKSKFTAQFAAGAALLILAAFSARGATVSFQDRTYAVTIVPLAKTVPPSSGADLIFVVLPNNQKFLAIPTNPAERAVFDPNNQRFYRLDRSIGLINAFTALNCTLINLDGTFFGTRTETPPANGAQSSLESYAIPLNIDPTVMADIAVLDTGMLSYRTSQTNVYEITRTNPSIAQKTIAIPLIATGAVAVDFDAENGTHLLVETAVTDTKNVALPDRISSYFRNGTKFSEIILDNNPAIPGYTGNASGIAYDVDTSDIYVLDGNQLIVFTLQRPALTSVTPNHGPVTGAVTVQVIGANIPPDAIIFFAGVQAPNIMIKSNALIICNPPPHALGTVDVTMTGTGILPGAPATLAGAFSYVNNPPVAVLSASPTQGTSPLSVLFDVGASADSDGTLAKRFIDFGDGTNFTFTTDLSITTTTHVYTGNGTFQATLTVTDDLGATGTDNKIILVGKGGNDFTSELLVKGLALRIETNPKHPPGVKDQLTLSGQVVLPFGLTPLTLGGGTVSVSVNDVIVSSTGPGSMLNARGQIALKYEKFSMRQVTAKGTPAGTYTFSYTLNHTSLAAANPVPAPPAPTPPRVSIPIVLKIVTAPGRVLAYEKTGVNQAVLDVRANKAGATLSLVRN